MVNAVQPSRSPWPTLAIFILALLQFCLCLSHRDITTAFEGRTAETAREMLQRREWVVPYCNGHPRLAKPPLMYWACDIAWTIVGKVDVWSARLPAALCGALAVLLLMDLARRTLGRDAALCAGLVWISTWFIVDEFRKAMADPYLAFFTLLSIWAWITADQTKDNRSSRWLILLAYASAALGALAKAHLIFLHMALALIPYHWLRRKFPSHLKTHAIGFAVLLVIASAWPVYIFFTVPNAWAVWKVDILASEATSGEKFSPIWDYVLSLPLTAAPWSVVALIGAIVPFMAKRRRERRALWPLIWLAATVIFFTLLPMKKNAYLLPAMPAQTLLVASVLASCVRHPRAAIDAARERTLLVGHWIGEVIALAVCTYKLLRLPQFKFALPIAVALAGIVAIIAAIAARWIARPIRSLRTLTGIALLFGLSVGILEGWTLPAVDNARSDAPFGRMICDRLTENDMLVLIGPGLREDVLFYIGGRTVPSVPSIDKLPPDFHGYAIIFYDQYDSVRASQRGEEVAVSADRHTDNQLHLFRFPSPPAAR